ncbi:MAG: T9SS type A sorting domain-containing protein [Flavobacteriales bacterium]
MKIVTSVVLFATFFLSAAAQDFLNVVEFGSSFPHNSGSRIQCLGNGDFVHFDQLVDNVDVDPGSGTFFLNGFDNNGLVLSRYTSEGALVWTNFIPSIYSSYYDLAKTPDEDLLICGGFIGAIDFDFGPGEAILDSGANGALFVCSFASDGSLNWAKSIEGISMNNWLVGQSISSDSNGNALVAGYFSSSVDFDPGTGEHILTSFDSDIDAYILKLDGNGDLVFANSFGGEMHDYNSQIVADYADNIVVRGTTRVSMDMDPGPGEFILESSGVSEVGYLAKYDNDGGFIWAFNLTTNASTGIESDLMNTDGNGNILLGGLTYSYCDFDPGSEQAIISGEDIYWYLVKYSADGELVWLKNGLGATPHCAVIDNEGNVYTSGIATYTGDLDGGIGVFNPGSGLDNVDLYCAKYNASGDFVWGFGLTGSEFVGGSWTTDIEIDANNNLVVAGLYQGNLDVDPGEGVTAMTGMPSSWPLFVATYGQGICGNTSMIISEAENLSCADYTGILAAEFTTGLEPFNYQWSTGETTSSIEASQIGLYTVIGTDANGCEIERDVIVSGPSTPDNFDLNPNAMAWNFVPGFDTQIQLDAFNDGCEYATGSLILTLDPALTLLNVNPPADNINGNIITWNFADINYDSEHLTPSVTVNTPVETLLGDIMNISVEMTPSVGDYFISNNIKNYEYEVVGSYDPNIIEVYPKGTGDQGYINANETMTYTIHFQNTGTAPAVNIDVLDVIDADLNINTVQVIGSSHAMHTEVENGNTLRFVFNDIMLPDSTNNEPESHGYVIYTIQQQPNLPFYTQMENTAAIYFDFNAPVITNTVLNTIEGPNFVDESALGNLLQLYPSPASTSLTIQCGNSRDNLIKIVSMEGRQVASFRTLQSQLVYDVSELANGLYEVRLTDENGNIRSNRFLKK